MINIKDKDFKIVLRWSKEHSTKYEKYEDCIRHYDDEGLLHNTIGPAIEYDNGSKKYFLHGIEYSFEDWQKIVLFA